MVASTNSGNFRGGSKKAIGDASTAINDLEKLGQQYPETSVLSTETGYRRDYSRNPYAGYFNSKPLMFPVKPLSDKLPVKSRVLGIWTDKSSIAFPEYAFNKDRTRMTEELDGKKFTVEYNLEARSFRVIDADDGIHWMYSLWFAWYAFHPETSVADLTKVDR